MAKVIFLEPKTIEAMSRMDSLVYEIVYGKYDVKMCGVIRERVGG